MESPAPHLCRRSGSQPMLQVLLVPLAATALTAKRVAVARSCSAPHRSQTQPVLAC